MLCPNHLVDQWASEIEKFTNAKKLMKKDRLKVLKLTNVGPLKQSTVKQIKEYDVIIAAYGLFQGEYYQKRIELVSMKMNH